MKNASAPCAVKKPATDTDITTSAPMTVRPRRAASAGMAGTTAPKKPSSDDSDSKIPVVGNDRPIRVPCKADTAHTPACTLYTPTNTPQASHTSVRPRDRPSWTFGCRAGISAGTRTAASPSTAANAARPNQIAPDTRLV